MSIYKFYRHKKKEITYLPKQSQPPDSLLSSLLLMVYSQFSCCSHYSACIWSHTALWRALFIASFDRVLRIVALLRKLCLLFLFVCILISFFSTWLLMKNSYRVQHLWAHRPKWYLSLPRDYPAGQTINISCQMITIWILSTRWTIQNGGGEVRCAVTIVHCAWNMLSSHSTSE